MPGLEQVVSCQKPQELTLRRKVETADLAMLREQLPHFLWLLQASPEEISDADSQG